MIERWVRAKSGKGHYDLGDRVSQSSRVRSAHVIVTACKAHLDGSTAVVISESYRELCSNCKRIASQRRARKSPLQDLIPERDSA
jgi:hypothetical protein